MLGALAPLARVLSVVHLLSALRSLFATTRADSVPIIVELLSKSTCPASIVLLLRLAAAGSVAASGAALALSHDGVPARAAVRGGLAGHAAVNLLAGQCAGGDRTLSELRAAQPPAWLHLASLSLCARDRWPSLDAPRQPSPPPPSSPSALKPGDFVWLLDIDGTLVQTDDLYFEAFKQLLEPFGHVVDDPFYSANVHGKVDADVFVNLMPPGTTQDELDAMSVRKDQLFCELYRKKAKAQGMSSVMIPGIAEALTLAQQLGIRCIAVTNAPRGAAEACISSLKETIPAAAAMMHDTIVVGAECKRAKPNPDPYLEGMRLLGVTPERCIVFEDSGSGVRAGVACGARAVVGLRSCMSDEQLRALGASTTVDDWTSITDGFLNELLDATAPAPSASPGGLVAAVPPLATLMLAAAMTAAPAAIAEAALLCKGADHRLPATAVRAYAAGLLPLGALLIAAQHEDGLAPSPSRRRGVALALLASAAVQANALRDDGHALRRWARRSILPPIVAAGAVGAWGAVKA